MKPTQHRDIEDHLMLEELDYHLWLHGAEHMVYYAACGHPLGSCIFYPKDNVIQVAKFLSLLLNIPEHNITILPNNIVELSG